MPSNLPSSFASAAAGQSRASRLGRDGSGSGSGDWARREGRSANGTLTFRRPSTTPFSQTQQQSEATLAQTPSAELGQHSALPSGPTDGPPRYSREQLFYIYEQASDEPQPVDVESLYLTGWSPGQINGSSARGWGKSTDGPIPQDPSVCWDADGRVKPIGLQEMSPEEKELFASDVNSTLKLPQQKDGTQGGTANGRKASVSHGSNYGLSSPSTTSRPSTRRRETGETNPFPSAGLTSPTATRGFSRDESWFGRKSIDTKEQAYEEPDEEANMQSAKQGGFASLMRSNTAGSAGYGGTSAVWGPSGTTPTSAMGGSFGSFAMPSTIGDKRFGASRGESRLAHLMPKDSSESITSRPSDGSNTDMRGSWRSRQRTDTDPYGENGMSGSAALRGDETASPPPPAHGPRGHSYDIPMDATTADFGMSGLNLGAPADENASGTPETNPYRSPPAERGDEENEHEHAGVEKPQPIGAGSEHASNFGSLSRGFNPAAFDGSDRSQTSSGGAKGFPPLNNLGGWPSAINTSAPDRGATGFGTAFGSSLFSPGGSELQSPGFGGMPGVFGVVPIGSSTSLRGNSGSRMNSLFPSAMQAQMQNPEQQGLGDSVPDLRQAHPHGAIGRGASTITPLDTDSARRVGRGVLEDFGETTRSSSIYPTTEQAQPGMTSTAPPIFHENATHAENQQNPQRTMVLPDRMRWQYLDPQREVQGPFTGLEMNDWFKAQFFNADLRVKRLEDADFEPLGQLIRRIGNSREPFLVPQMGVPHGPPSLSGPFSPGDRGVILPPLLGAFPSFGRTLTAEEQNNLERRKQEEQVMVARQREMIGHHAYPKMGMPPQTVVPGALHHHSSAHSLQSQPSFGSITSPLSGPQPPIPAIGQTPGSFFDQSLGMPQQAAQAAVTSHPEYGLNPAERQMLANLQGSRLPAGSFPQQPIGAPSGDMRSNLPGIDQLQKDSLGFSERVKEFRDLRAQRDAEDAASKAAMASVVEEPQEDVNRLAPAAQAEAGQVIDQAAEERLDGAHVATKLAQALSLTQQVQKTQAAAAAAKQRVHTDDAWIKPPSELPGPFPPPQAQSVTPLAAPTAQRTRSTLPDQYAASRSQSETPESAIASASTQAPPAPWAREPGTDSHKVPSMKEIQEAEAKTAARQEEAAAAARRAATEQEIVAQREREKTVLVPAPGLPTSSTWGSGSPVAATTGSAWAKPGPVKGAPGLTHHAPTSGGNKKKTLADIQREEEAHKARERQQTSTTTAGPSTGKRYADLASKGQPPSAANHATGGAPVTGGGWATVGAGGKVKAPTGPAAGRSVSAGNVKNAPAPAPSAPVRPAAKQNSSVVSKIDAGGAAMDEFTKWLHRELARGITGGIDISTFASNLLVLPLEPTLIADAVYASSMTMDGRHFAEEFIRRKKLADKGVVEKQPTAASSSAGDNKSGGGWSEVAKKSSGSQQKEDSAPSGFKVVPGRKKGKK